MISKTVVAILVSAFLITSPVLAVDGTSSGRVPALKEKIATRQAQIKAKLNQFKDRKKAEIAERLNTNLNKINQNRTNEMLKHLDKMLIILEKLETRTNTRQEETKAIIASASAIVKNQAQKDYTIPITSEAKVKADAQKIRLQLHTDLQAVRKQVIEAKQSVANAVRSAKSNAGK